MDQLIGMLVIWAIVEFVQFLRKRPYPACMKTGAKWAMVAGTLVSIGRMDKSAYTESPWLALLGSALFCAAVVLAIYWLRVLLAKGWVRLRT